MRSHLRGRFGVLTGVIVTSLLCFGCASPDIPASISTYDRNASEEGGDSGLLRGTVETTNGCTIVIASNAEGSFVPIFDSADDRTSGLSNGDSVSLSGGVVAKPPQGSSIPDGCAEIDAQYWLVSY